MLTDYHLHLRPDDLDATFDRYMTAENVASYRAAAGAAGIAELGVSEHVHRFRQALDVWDHPFWIENAVDDLDAYVAFVREQSDLRLGIEMDFVPGREDAIAELLDGHGWDYVVGSVHFIGDDALDYDPFDVWRRIDDAEEVWRRYFAAVAASARSGLFDIVAHPDLVKYWGKRHPAPTGDLRRFYEPAVSAFADAGVAVELSTAGLRKPVGELYPAREMLALCVEAGVPVALSSDAHSPDDVGYAYDHAVAELRDLGVDRIAVFDGRKRTLAPLGATGRSEALA